MIKFLESDQIPRIEEFDQEHKKLEDGFFDRAPPCSPGFLRSRSGDAASGWVIFSEGLALSLTLWKQDAPAGVTPA